MRAAGITSGNVETKLVKRTVSMASARVMSHLFGSLERLDDSPVPNHFSTRTMLGSAGPGGMLDAGQAFMDSCSHNGGSSINGGKMAAFRAIQGAPVLRQLMPLADGWRLRETLSIRLQCGTQSSRRSASTFLLSGPRVYAGAPQPPSLEHC